MHVFAFLNLEHPPVAWAVMRGIMVSADHASPSANQGFISFMQAGMIEHQNNARIFNESIIEGIRNVSFASRVSRMRGLYFFRRGRKTKRVLVNAIGRGSSVLKIYSNLSFIATHGQQLLMLIGSRLPHAVLMAA